MDWTMCVLYFPKNWDRSAFFCTALKQRSSVYNAALAEPHLSQELPPLVEHTTDEVTTMPSDAKNSPSITDDMIVVGPSKQEYSLHPNTTSDVITAINQTSTLSNPNQATEVCSTSQRQVCFCFFEILTNFLKSLHIIY